MVLMAALAARKKLMAIVKQIYEANKELQTKDIALIVADKTGLTPRKAKEYVRDAMELETLKNTQRIAEGEEVTKTPKDKEEEWE